MKFFKARIRKMDVDRSDPNFDSDIYISVNGSDPFFFKDDDEVIISEEIKNAFESAVEERIAMPRRAKEGINLDNGETFEKKSFPRYQVQIIEEMAEKDVPEKIKTALRGPRKEKPVKVEIPAQGEITEPEAVAPEEPKVNKKPEKKGA